MHDEGEEIERLIAARDLWRDQAYLYANAWAGELGDEPVSNAPLVDALVLRTREAIARGAKHEAGLPDSVEAWRMAQKAWRAAMALYDARRAACLDMGLPPDAALEWTLAETARRAVDKAAQAMSIALGCEPPGVPEPRPIEERADG